MIPGVGARRKHAGNFLEVLIDPEAGVYPMVGPGLSYRDTITGDFIPKRYENAKPAEPDQSEIL